MQYWYKAYLRNGKETVGQTLAATEAEALENVEKLGLTVFHISTSPVAEKPWYTKDISLFSPGFSDKETSALCQHLSNMTGAGLTLTESLKVAAETQPNKKLRRALIEIQSSHLEGYSLAEAFRSKEGEFPTEFLGLLTLADNTNSLTVTLGDTAKYFRSKAATKDQLTSALIYPAILVLTGIALIGLLIAYLIPLLSSLFENAGVAPPIVFNILNGVADFLGKFGLFTMFALIAAVICLKLWSKTQAGKIFLETALSYLPVIGTLKQRNHLEQICNALALLLKSGTGIGEACSQLSATTDSPQFAALCKKIAKDVQNGEQVSDSIASSKILPDEFKSIISLAETSNRWSDILSAYSTTLAQENKHMQERLMSLLTPAITVFVGLFAGLLVYSIMSALLEINSIVFQ